MSRQILTNWSKGEAAPELYGRPDAPQYRALARKVRNFIIDRAGGLKFRPGFRLVGEADDTTTPIRYLPFQYSIEQAYVLALDDARMRVFAFGGFVLEDNLKITAITKSASAQVTAAYHGYDVGQKVFFYNVVGMTQINGMVGNILYVVDPDNFIVDIDTRTFADFISSDGITRVATPPPTPTPPPPAPTPTPPPPPDTGGGGGTGGGLGGGGWGGGQYENQL